MTSIGTAGLDRRAARAIGSVIARAPLAALALAVAVAAGGPVSAAPQQRILETGSSLLYPMFNLWVADYSRAHGNVQITTQSTGSGAGIAQAISGIAQIGASDAYLSDPQMRQSPGVLNIPLAVSAQTIDYNIPGLNNRRLNLSGPVLAGIYTGRIRNWDDAAIRAINPGVALPHHAIVPIHRADGSGDTFIFTQYLAFSTPSWASSLAYGATVNWPPVPQSLGANGNPGMVNAARSTPYSIAYIGVSFRSQARRAGLGEAALQNRSGRFVAATVGAISAALAATAGRTPPDERLSLVFAPGPAAYPIINYEYAMVKAQQPSPVLASDLQAFLGWVISPAGGGSARYLSQAGFVGLPAAVRSLSARQIAQIR
ncbi:MAG TPA: phosphate ABC transporter substrate-binding protein PstS [Caulobacteraceae bacterium]|nr:phosphate ABC transporter substrate-binding protein PstS [Caulobacteraceae bacterium]